MINERYFRLDDLPNERWKDIIGYEGLYQISDWGRVKSLYRQIDRTHVYNEKILKPSKDKDGYLFVYLCKDGKRKYTRIHQLVGKYFVPNPENKPIFDHIKPVEKDYCNNHYTNLQPVTYSENSKRAYLLGRKVGKNTPKYGIDNPKAKKVIQFDLNMNKIREWEYISLITKELGYLHGSIVSCCKGRYKQAYGYIWRYYEEVKDELEI